MDEALSQDPDLVVDYVFTDNELVKLCGAHWNVTGHRIAAEVLADRIQAIVP